MNTAVAITTPIPDDELLAAELARLDRKIDAADAEKRRLVDLYQAGLIELAELQRRAADVAARHRELQAKRTSLAEQRTALARGNQVHRRVHDFAERIRGVIDHLDAVQKQQLLRCSSRKSASPAGTSRSGYASPSTSHRQTPHNQTGHPTRCRPRQRAPCQAKTVCVPLVVRTSAWWTTRSIIAAATAWSPKTPPQPLNGRLRGQDQRGVFVAAGDELEEQVRGVLLEGQVADLVDDDQPVAAQPGRARAGSRPARWASVSRVTHSVAVANRTRWPWWAAAMPRPVARWVLPVPGGPSSTTLRASVRNPPEARAAICWRTAGWASQSNSSIVFRAANPAARIRSWAPEALRAATSRSSTAARYSSWVQPASRAWSASRAAASVIRGAFNADAR